jgi:hypothetical protein
MVAPFPHGLAGYPGAPTAERPITYPLPSQIPASASADQASATLDGAHSALSCAALAPASARESAAAGIALLLAPHAEAQLAAAGIESVRYGRVRAGDGTRGFEVRLAGHGEVVRVVAYGTAGAAVALRDVVARAADLWAASFDGRTRYARAAADAQAVRS